MAVVQLPHRQEGDDIRDKAVRLFTFLREVTALKEAKVRDLATYEAVLWLHQIPTDPSCHNLARLPPNTESESWIQIRKPRLMPPPKVPALIADLLRPEDVGDSSLDFPQLLVPGSGTEGEGNPELREENGPRVSEVHETWVQNQWWPWAEADRKQKPVRDVYADLFTIYQRQQRLGESFEVVLGLGYLTWRTGPIQQQTVKRHLVVAQALITFEPDHGLITVSAAGDGAKLALEHEMLDPDAQPEANELASLTAMIQGAGDSPFDGVAVPSALRAWVHSVSSHGAYDDAIEPQTEVGEHPVVNFAPALILRKRSERSLLAMLDGIIDELRHGGPVPPGVEALVEIRDDQASSAEDGGEAEESSSLPDGEIYFPLPANREQQNIVSNLGGRQGVLVQGPPGTGKSHTIVNLISHLLASGQRILVTSHAPRALEVLRDLLPKRIEALAVILLGNDLRSLQSMEASVQGISSRYHGWQSAATRERISELATRVDDIRREEAILRGKLREARRADTTAHGARPGGYVGTTQSIAERLRREQTTFSWLADVPPSGPPSLSDAEALELLGLIRDMPSLDEDADLTRLVDINRVPLGPAFETLVLAEHSARSRTEGDGPVMRSIAEADREGCRSAEAALSSFVSAVMRFRRQSDSWVVSAVEDVLVGRDGGWVEIKEATNRAIQTIGEVAKATSEYRLSGINGHDRQVVRGHAMTLLAHLEAGKGRGIPGLRPRPIKEGDYLLKQVRVNGRLCDQPQVLRELIAWIDVSDHLDYLDLVWARVRQASQAAAPPSARLAHFGDLLSQLIEVLELREARSKAERSVTAVRGLSIASWLDLEAISRVTEGLAIVRRQHELADASIPLTELSAQLRMVARRPGVSPVVSKLLTAVESRDIEAFVAAQYELTNAHKKAARAARARELLSRLRTVLPDLASDILATAPRLDWDVRLGHFEAAWYWAQADTWIREISDPALHGSWLRQLEDLRLDGLRTMGELAAEKAWDHCLSRLTANERQHLQAWALAVRRIGRGTGKRAGTHREQARQHMNECRGAIPAWIMPIYRVAEMMRPGVDAFDVVIVDEASQSGPEALFLQYLGKKVVVVGDDMQISPSNVGLQRSDVDILARRWLHGIPHADALGYDNSFFDQAAIRYSGRIRLREHFRCMPEIIQFSNNLCYRNEPLIPVRQFGAGRLTPTVLTRHVPSGYLMPGRRNQNQPEAEAIVEQIVRCCDDQAYEGKTMGVISLVGEEQAKLIERMLTQRLGPELMEARHLDCGDAYAFQGAERDVMFLSLVVAPDLTRRIATQTDEATKRRFNVAASRARDQMWLFHTALLSDLNSKEDLKYRLLDYCLNPHVEPAAGAGGLSLEELIRRAASRVPAEAAPPPFDSWFEVEVFIRLAQAGYRVLPQYELAGYRVDLLVEGMRGRIAVECDGDRWHGPERFDEDAARQRDLERCGLHFVRIPGTSFGRDPEATMTELFAEFDRNKVRPEGAAEPNPDSIPHEKDLAVLDDRAVRHGDESPSEDSEESTQPPVADELTAPGYSGPNYRGGVQPYREWRSRPLPSPSSHPSAILEGLVEIVTQEGPIVTTRAFQLYVHAAGGRKVGSSIREALHDAASLGQRRGVLVSKAELDGGGPLDAVLRIPGTPDVVLREAGPRESIQEIPPAEIGALMHQLTRGSWSPTGETLYRAVLARYGKVRLTEQTLAHLARIERRYLQNRESGPPALNS